MRRLAHFRGPMIRKEWPADPLGGTASSAIGVERPNARLDFVDGMRTIAILAVVAYHINLPGASGGYVGVDIFFVISGFLIIGQVTSSVTAGRFSFYQFYARRILRILPPFFLVLLATMCAGLFGLLFGFELERLGLSGMAAATMVANMYFFFTSGYFAARAAAEPFLHTWTLSVEEQFYLGAPVFIVGVAYLAARARRPLLRPMAIVMAIALVASLAACVVATSIKLPFAFYMPITRSWEFTAGGVLAVLVGGGFRLPKRASPYAAWAGMALMILAVVWFSDDTPFPGWAAGIPVLGAVLVLADGLTNPTSIPLRLLATRPAILIGHASYSWYLWHWPVLYLARTWLGDGAWIDLAAAGLSLLLAFATYFALERPLARVRHSAFVRTCAPRIVLGGVAASLLVAVFAFAIARIGESQVAGAASAITADKGPFSDCRSKTQRAGGTTCRLGGSDPLSVIVWGDSHAEEAIPGLDALGKELGEGALAISNNGCAPLVGWQVYTKGIRQEDCTKENDIAIHTIRERAASADLGVVLAARWMYYSGTGWPKVNDEHADIRPADRESTPFPSYQSRIKAALSETVDALLASGVRRILLVGPHPQMVTRPPDCLLRIGLSSPWRDTCSVKRTASDELDTPFLDAARELSSLYPQLRFVDPRPIFCGARYCRPFDGDEVLYRDSDHLSHAGGVKLYKMFVKDFRWVFGSP